MNELAWMERRGRGEEVQAHVAFVRFLKIYSGSARWRSALSRVVRVVRAPFLCRLNGPSLLIARPVKLPFCACLIFFAYNENAILFIAEQRQRC
jgi:hypothetical protein